MLGSSLVVFVGKPGRGVTVFVGHCKGTCRSSTVWLLCLKCIVIESVLRSVFPWKSEDSLLFRLVGGIGGLIKLVPLGVGMGECKTTFSECMWGRFV